MTQIHQLTFGPFAENTYLISDEDGNTILIDPGMYYPEENAKFLEYLQAHQLKPTRLILTHAHLDHVFGVNWVHTVYGLTPEHNKREVPVYASAQAVANRYGLTMDTLIPAKIGLVESTSFTFGGEQFEILLAPGHSPGSVCFYNRNEKYIISGDVLFQGSIGRTDLPGGDYNTLMRSIQSQLLTLEDDVVVYSGHGAVTTIGQERRSNEHLQDFRM